MEVFAIKIDVNPEHSLEFTQTSVEMVRHIQNEKGNLNTILYQDINNKYSLFILTEWKTVEDLNRYMQSDHYKALQWAISDMTHSSAVNLRRVPGHDAPL